jgi:hypothetical protein
MLSPTEMSAMPTAPPATAVTTVPPSLCLVYASKTFTAMNARRTTPITASRRPHSRRRDPKYRLIGPMGRAPGLAGVRSGGLERRSGGVAGWSSTGTD